MASLACTWAWARRLLFQGPVPVSRAVPAVRPNLLLAQPASSITFALLLHLLFLFTTLLWLLRRHHALYHPTPLTASRSFQMLEG